MTLSEAIRLGAMLKPQAFGDYTDGRGTCAWGAASEAAGRDVDDNDIPDEWFHDYPFDAGNQVAFALVS
jgi:hypothetical protein